MCASMMEMPSTLAPNLSVPCGRPAVGISGGATGAAAAGAAGLCALATRLKGATARLLAMPKNARRVTSLWLNMGAPAVDAPRLYRRLQPKTTTIRLEKADLEVGTTRG